jgi:quinol monooxygenase YgiN
MTVIVIADVHGQTAAGYDGMFQALAEPTRQAAGFVFHSAYQADGLWRVVEVWNSKAEANQFFAGHIAAHLPPGVRPKRAVFEVHSLLTK